MWLRPIKWMKDSGWKGGRFGRKLSKSVTASQVPDLRLDRLKLELEHFPVRRFARRGHLRLRLREGQLESGLARLAHLLVRRQCRPHRLVALCFFLLRFDRLALKPTRHH